LISSLESPVPNPGGFDALLFDLGGVIIEVDFNRALERWAEYAGCAPTLLKARFTQDVDYQRHERGEIDAAGYFASLRASLGITITDAQFLDGWEALLGAEIPEVTMLLRRVRLPLYLFSNSNHAHHQIWSRRYAVILSLFRRVFVSSDIGKRKPDPAAFLAVAGGIGVPAERILFFDDTLENVEGARVSGMSAVQVRSVADVEKSLKGLI